MFQAPTALPQYPLDRRLGGPHGRSGRRGEEKILDSTRIRTPTFWSSSPQLVAMLRHHGSQYKLTGG
jgi:hypothetical protein